MVKMFNFWYFFFIIVTLGAIVGLYFLFRNKSMKAKKILIISLLMFNFVLHFVKAFMYPYNVNPEMMIENTFCINICAVSVVVFPFLYFSKSNTAKDWMFYLGCISGFLAVFYPTSALNRSIELLDVWRFYVCHIIIFITPLLMVMLGIHKLNYRNVWKMPLCMLLVLLFIMCNQVLLAELGAIDLRGNDIFAPGCNYRNTSLIWGPTDGVAALFTWLTPKFMKTIPFGEFAGQEKYWPFFYLIPGIILYFTVIPFLLSLIWEHKRVKEDLLLLTNKIKSLKVFNKSNDKQKDD